MHQRVQHCYFFDVSSHDLGLCFLRALRYLANLVLHYGMAGVLRHWFYLGAEEQTGGSDSLAGLESGKGVGLHDLFYDGAYLCAALYHFGTFDSACKLGDFPECECPKLSAYDWKR